jgi:hypothetical protein
MPVITVIVVDYAWITSNLVITCADEACSLAADFLFMIAYISSMCHGRKSCVSTTTSIDSDSGSSGKLPCEWP